MKRWQRLKDKHFDMFGYSFNAPFEVISGNTKEVEKFTDLLEKSITKHKDYIVGNYGITENYIAQQKKPPEDTIWD